MKLALAVLPIITGMLSTSHATVIALDVGVSALTPTGKTFDIDGDSITDFTFRGNGGVCTADVPTSACVFAVTIQGRAGVEFLLDQALSGRARPLVPGDILGPGSTGVWDYTEYFSLSVASVMHLLDPDPANSGYPDYMDGFEVYSIGFRQSVGGDEPRYGWVDVALSMPVIGGDDSTPDGIGIPRILGIHFSDTLGETVEFTPVPEVSPGVLLVLSGWLALTQHNRRMLVGSAT